MATNDSRTTAEGFCSAPPRLDVAVRAAMEAEYCAIAALRQLQEMPQDQEHFAANSALRAMVLRMRELAGVTVASLTDNSEELRSMEERLTGVEAT